MNIKPERAEVFFRQDKSRMNRKIRSIFPRGKKCDALARNCIALPKNIREKNE